MITTTMLGLKSNKCWFLVTGLVGAFLLEHALYGWCPPLPIIRKMGIRTAEEINLEKMVLKKLRGDFSENTSDVVKLYNMVVKK